MAVSGNDVYCRLSKAEFEGLSRKPVGTIADGATVSLLWLQQLVTASQGDKALLQTTKTKAEELAATIGQLLV